VSIKFCVLQTLYLLIFCVNTMGDQLRWAYGICFSGSPPLYLRVGLFRYVIILFQAVDLTRLKASEIDFRVAQLEKEFTLSGAQRSGFWEEFEVSFALNLLHSQVCSCW